MTQPLLGLSDNDSTAITLCFAPYARTKLSYLRHFLARSGEYSHLLFILVLMGWRSGKAGNKLTASLAQMSPGARKQRQYHNTYRAETVLGQRELTCRLHCQELLKVQYDINYIV